MCNTWKAFSQSGVVDVGKRHRHAELSPLWSYGCAQPVGAFEIRHIHRCPFGSSDGDRLGMVTPVSPTNRVSLWIKSPSLNTRIPTTPTAQLHGIAGWLSWKWSSIRARLRACWGAETLADLNHSTPLANSARPKQFPAFGILVESAPFANAEALTG
jgi:hypothetical protein